MVFTNHAVARYNSRVDPVRGRLDACTQANVLVSTASKRGFLSLDRPGPWFRIKENRMRAGIVLISAVREIAVGNITRLEEVVLVVDKCGTTDTRGWVVITVMSQFAEDIDW